MARRVTARDVASRAGVSRSAVSMVLNGRADGDVSRANQEAVRRAAEELGYRPNVVARSLRSSATQTIGVVTDSVTTGSFGGAIIAAASEVAAQSGYLLLVIDTHKDDSIYPEAVELLQARQCDGLFFVAEGLTPWTPPAAFLDDPCLLVNAFDPTHTVAGVHGDEVAGGRQAVRMLLERGHRDIVHLHGTDDVVADGMRLQGSREELAAAGLRPHLVPCGWELDRGLEVGGKLLDSRVPTGIVCANDRVAAGVFLAAARRGLRIPEDLSVVGYDNDPNLAPQLGLSTVPIPFDAMGRRAVHLLLGQVAGRPAPVRDVLLASQAVVRSSVAEPRPDDTRRAARSGRA